MSQTPRLSKEDIELFRNAVGSVKPIQQDNVLSSSSKPEPVPSKTLEDQRQVLNEMEHCSMDPAEIEMGDELQYRSPGIQIKHFKRLRRGQISIQAVLDLHGMTVAETKVALSKFIVASRAINDRCIKIIHGKGLGSKDGKPVLKNKVNQWLQQRNDVLAYCSAQPMDGGTGAIYVLLKR